MMHWSERAHLRDCWEEASLDGDGVHSPRLNHPEKHLSLKARAKEGHKVDCERSDNKALVIRPIQRLKKCHHRPPHMYRCKDLKLGKFYPLLQTSIQKD